MCQPRLQGERSIDKASSHEMQRESAHSEHAPSPPSCRALARASTPHSATAPPACISFAVGQRRRTLPSKRSKNIPSPRQRTQALQRAPKSGNHMACLESQSGRSEAASISRTCVCESQGVEHDPTHQR